MTEYGKGFADYSGRDFGKEFMMDKFGTDNPLGLLYRVGKCHPLHIFDAHGKAVACTDSPAQAESLLKLLNSHAALVDALKDIIEAADKSDNVPYRLLDEIESASKMLAALAAAGEE